MKSTFFVLRRRCLASNLAVASLLSLALLAQTSTAAERELPAKIVDVQLDAGGLFRGELVDPSGKPMPNVGVTLVSGNRVVAQMRTDAAGRFVAQNLRGGVYLVVTQQGAQQVYRLWAPGTAPPTASGSALLVQSGRTIRGQLNNASTTLGAIGQTLSNPFVITAGIAAGGLIPLIQDRKDQPSS